MNLEGKSKFRRNLEGNSGFELFNGERAVALATWRRGTWTDGAFGSSAAGSEGLLWERRGGWISGLTEWGAVRLPAVRGPLRAAGYGWRRRLIGIQVYGNTLSPAGF